MTGSLRSLAKKMRQRDRKRQLRPADPRLKNVKVPDLDSLDDRRERSEYKAMRTAEKQHDKYKNDAELVPGRILEVRTNYSFLVEAENELHEATLSGRLKQFSYSTTGLAAVGDHVELDISDAPNFRVENILLRRNTLSRYGDGRFQKEIIVAANIDQVVITSSWREPRIKTGLIDRYLCVAALEEIQPIIVINKIDLCEDAAELEQTLGYYRESGFELLYTSATSGEGMAELKRLLTDRDSVFSGQSGTGKSSLINWLEPGLDLRVASVSRHNEKGRHTTTQAILLPWSFGGHLLDTPGIKTVNLHRDVLEQIPKVFPGFAPLATQCFFRDCSHSHEEDCAVLDALEQGKIPVERYESYLRLMESLE